MPKIPLPFVRKYLKCKGRKELEFLACDDCSLMYSGYPWYDNGPPFDHPIQFLYDHASKGHTCWFIACFYWFWTSGGGPVPTDEKHNFSSDATDWTGCKTHIFVWKPTADNFVLSSVTTEHDWT